MSLTDDIARQKHYLTGDVVQLKSGGPKMTVRRHVAGSEAHKIGWTEFVSVDWLDVSGISHNQKFHPDQLEFGDKVIAQQSSTTDRG